MNHPVIPGPAPAIAILCCFFAFAVSSSDAQAPYRSSIVPPLLIEPPGEGDDRPELDLLAQTITVSLYQNGALVHLLNVIENPIEDSVSFAVRLPVEGYAIVRDGDTVGISSRLLEVVLWNEDESVVPQLLETDSTTDEVLTLTLATHATTTVEALFLVPTPAPPESWGAGADSALIPPGERFFTIILGGGAPDQEVVNESSVLLGFTDGLSPVDSLLSIDPLPTEETDSTVAWDWFETEDTPAGEIAVTYHTPPGTGTPFDTIGKLSAHARCCGLPDLREPEADDDR